MAAALPKSLRGSDCEKLLEAINTADVSRIYSRTRSPASPFESDNSPYPTSLYAISLLNVVALKSIEKCWQN